MRALALAVVAACSPIHYSPDYPGVPNIEQVDANVWRSGQITTSEGWRTVVDIADGRHVHVIKLNFEVEGDDREAADWYGFDLRELPIQPEGDQDAWDDVAGLFILPDPERVADAETTLGNARGTEGTDIYLVHCTHGQDRTGLVIGEHRVLHDGWSKRHAYGEMLSHHFHPEIIGLQSAWMAFEP